MAKVDPFKSTTGLSIIAYLGLTGAGKSLSAVENHVIPDLVKGRTVYSNTWLNWNKPNLKHFTKWSDLHNVRNSLIFIDEIGDILDPNKYKDFSDDDKNVIRYHRKRGNDLIYTAQDISDIAKQCRVKTHKFVLCEASPDSFIVSWFLKTFLNVERVCFRTLILTFKDLKKLSLGIGSPALDNPAIQQEEEESFSEDISDITETLSSSKEAPKPENLRFTFRTLEHKELNEFKINFFGSWCPDCMSYKSYFNTIPTEIDKCPSHPETSLIVKNLAMYDTNHELFSEEPDYITKKFKYTLKKVLTPISSDL